MMEKKITEIKNSKELINLQKAVTSYIEKYDGDAHVIVSVLGFKGDECVDDMITIFGEKKGIIIGLKDLLEQVKKDKEGFIVW
jgi:hypothetical protein